MRTACSKDGWQKGPGLDNVAAYGLRRGVGGSPGGSVPPVVTGDAQWTLPWPYLTCGLGSERLSSKPQRRAYQTRPFLWRGELGGRSASGHAPARPSLGADWPVEQHSVACPTFFWNAIMVRAEALQGCDNCRVQRNMGARIRIHRMVPAGQGSSGDGRRVSANATGLRRWRRAKA
jgi:hypothetical protein